MVPCNKAHCLKRLSPNKDAISIMASTSSAELKKGNRWQRMVNSITPADHISIFVVCAVHLKRTSGARKPLVPALLARREGRLSFLGCPNWVAWRMSLLASILYRLVSASS